MSVPATNPSRDMTHELIAFLSDPPGARRASTRVIATRLLRAVTQVVPCRDASMREEIVQQAFVILLQNPGRYDPTLGTAASFLCQVAREASRAVRAMYAPPATRKRERADVPRPAAPIPLDEVTDTEMMQSGQVSNDSADAIEALCDLRHLVPRMPPQLLLAFTSVAEGDTKIHAAQAAGITRFQLETRMTRFRREMQLAA